MSESITKKPDQKNNKKTKNKKRSLLRKVIAILILFIQNTPLDLIILHKKLYFKYIT